MLVLDLTSVTPLVTQILEGVAQAISEQRLRPGAKLPSIRKFSHTAADLVIHARALGSQAPACLKPTNNKAKRYQ
ncbi:TPA: hypothetical protein N2B23_001299 [Pseudomonas aeruginosa]|nr:hypothetical protein [Pseudomonas aeruginosa]